MSKSLVKIPLERVEKAILLIRGEKVVIDSDLATLYGVSTARLNQQVQRNIDRFPGDFMFRLTQAEFHSASVQVVRVFVKLRQMLVSNAELALKLEELERKYDHQFKIVFDAIRQLMTPPPAKIKPIGFRAKTLKK